jgi:hypothetical protein
VYLMITWCRASISRKPQPGRTAPAVKCSMQGDEIKSPDSIVRLTFGAWHLGKYSVISSDTSNQYRSLTIQGRKTLKARESQGEDGYS